MRITRIGVAAVAIAGVVAAGAALPSLAQDATETPEEEAGSRHEERERVFAAALAEELDLPQERVEEALDAVREDLRERFRARRLDALRERLDTAVEEGDLTQEQADAILAAAGEGILPLGLRDHHGPRGFRGWGAGPPTDGDA